MASRRARMSVVPLGSIVAFVGLYLWIATRHELPWWLPLAYVALSLIAFAVYGFDKSAAAGGRRRIPEQSLLLLGLIGGWPGAIVGQQVFRHKTAKRSFQVSFWVTVAVHVLAFVFWARVAT